MSAKAWTTDEKFVLLAKLLFRDGKVPPYSDIVMEGRSTKAIGNTLRDLNKQYGPDSDAAKGFTTEDGSKSPKKSATTPKKTLSKAKGGNKKRSNDDSDDGAEVATPKPKKGKKNAVEKKEEVKEDSDDMKVDEEDSGDES